MKNNNKPQEIRKKVSLKTDHLVKVMDQQVVLLRVVNLKSRTQANTKRKGKITGQHPKLPPIKSSSNHQKTSNHNKT
jgi:hypothetical protein